MASPIDPSPTSWATHIGVASRNGFAEPYATGFKPWVDLASNPILSGDVSWIGRLIGFTPLSEAVAGSAKLGIDLSTLSGNLDFTGLESWTANTIPGEIGTGVMWEDGDLAYSVSVMNNAFFQTGGDEGIVTGSFFGSVHEDMGGTLERVDLSAAFVGTR